MLWRIVRVLLVVFVVAGMTGGAAYSQSQVFQVNAPVGSAITYQGWLQKNGTAVEGVCDLKFALFDAASNGSQVGSTLERPNQVVTGGYFTVGDLDFGVVFTGQARWIEVAVRCPAGSGEFTTLAPRQQLAPAPYALHAVNNWSLQGNATTNPTVNFIGTTDPVSLTFKVSDTVALRLAPGEGAPNVIGGIAANQVDDGVVGATIAGGGEIDAGIAFPNRITDDYGVVAGGSNNQAGDNGGTGSDRAHATVGGGRDNTATGRASTISGGQANVAAADYATVGGGVENNALALGTTIAGGSENNAGGNHATIGGGIENVASAQNGTIGGGFGNQATAENATISGGIQNQADGTASTIGGGENNQTGESYATVGGGSANLASAAFATITGGTGAHASHYGEWAYASGTFNGEQGSAQTSIYVMRGVTTDNNDVVLNLGAPEHRLTIDDLETVVFEIQIAARATGGKSAGYTTRGVIENSGGSVAFVGLVPVTTLGTDDAGWGVTVTADAVNNSLAINVNGDAGETVHWVATVRTTEVHE